MSQGRYWLLTIPQYLFTPYLPSTCVYIKGQLENGNTTGYSHWQVLVVFDKKVRLGGIKSVFGDGIHAELSRSDAADKYVWKEDTRVAGTQFELGARKLKRSCPKDWDKIVESCKQGRFDEVPGDILLRNYGNVKRLAVDYSRPVGIIRTVEVYWGPTGLGKSRKAWDVAGHDAYPKDPNTKFWDGYRDHKSVVIDEFRGLINISNLLRWFDRYPVLVEVKGSAVVLKAEKIIITSNLHPREWYPLIDVATYEALLRRLIIHDVSSPLYELS